MVGCARRQARREMVVTVTGWPSPPWPAARLGVTVTTAWLPATRCPLWSSDDRERQRRHLAAERRRAQHVDLVDLVVATGRGRPAEGQLVGQPGRRVHVRRREPQRGQSRPRRQRAGAAAPALPTERGDLQHPAVRRRPTSPEAVVVAEPGLTAISTGTGAGRVVPGGRPAWPEVHRGGGQHAVAEVVVAGTAHGDALLDPRARPRSRCRRTPGPRSCRRRRARSRGSRS